MHSNHRPRPRRKKHLTVTKRLLASSQLSSPLPTELINELTELNPNGPELPRGRAPIHNTFLMSFDVELPFFAGFAPFFVLFYRCKRANDPLCLCDNLLSVRSFLSPSFCLLSPPSRPVWDWQTGKKPIHDSVPGMKPNKLKSAQYFMTDQNWHNLVNCCHRQKLAWIFSNRKRCSRSTLCSYL